MKKTVADVMTTNPAKVSRLASAADVAKLMRHYDVGSVPVVEDGNLVGIITDRDIALRVVAEERDPTMTYAGEIATADPRAAGPGESLEQAYRRMASWRVRRLPVVNGERLVGMLAQADLVHELKDRRAGRLVDEISQPGGYPYRREVGLR
jgi:CBS domain-containing protein